MQDQTYRPLAKVRLTFRFDEFGDDLSAIPPDKPATMRKGQKDPGRVLDYELDPDAVGTRYVLKGRGETQIQTVSADDRTHTIEGIIPARASLEVNSIREADTLELELPYLDFPFDPRTIRSCAVEYFLGTIGAHEWGEAMRQGVAPDLPDESDYGSNRRFIGWVDDDNTVWEDAPGMVTLSCRDNTSLFIDQPAPPQIKVDPKIPIDEAVVQYLACFPQFEGIAVEYRHFDEEPPLLADIVQKQAQRNKGIGPDKEGSVWDFLTDVVGMVGCVVFVEGSTVVIQKPRTLYADGQQRDNDPFQGRTHEGLEMKTRTFIYGRNLESFGVERRFNANAPKNVEVRCYLPERKKTLVVRFPGVTTKAMPGESADKGLIVWRVQGINSKDALQVIAQSVYEEISRQEISVNLKTYNLASFGGDNTEPDVLWLQSGDPVEVLFAKGDQLDVAQIPSTQAQLENALLSETSTADYLERLGYGPELARAYARAYSAAGYQTIYRVQKVAIDWSDDEGVSIAIDAINYVEVRYDKVL
jgi:hypothetical protein